jgi:hypothetical protein
VSPTATTMVVYAFDINQSTDDLISAPGTKPGVVSEGDESVVNDQLTSIHLTKHGKSSGYPIIGYDSGTCIYTRVTSAHQTFENCVVTGVLPGGSITVQGVITTKSGVRQPATLALTSGTGSFEGAHGTVKVAFAAKFNTYTIAVQ